MSFNTTKANVPSLTTLVSPDLLGGKKKFGVSLWLRFTKRTTNYTFLFGNTEDYGNHTHIIDVKYHSTTMFMVRIALHDPATNKKAYYSVLYPIGTPISEGSWVHLWITYDSTEIDKQLKGYINGFLSATTTTPQYLTWLNPTSYNLKLTGTATVDTTDFGEIAIYAGDTLPNIQSIIDYTNGQPLPVGAVLNYKNVSASDTPIVPPQILTEVNGHYLQCVSGQGTLTPEIPEKTASIKVVKETIKTLGSGESVWTEWTTLNGGDPGTLIKTPNINPSIKIRRKGQLVFEPEVSIVNYILKKNLIIWVIPKEARPTSVEDQLVISFPISLLTTSNLQFSEKLTISPQNNFGKIHYKLPPQPRAKVGTCGAGTAGYGSNCYVFNNQALTVGPWYTDVTINDRGFPVSNKVPKSRAFAYIYAWDLSKPVGEVYVMWKGTTPVGFSSGTLLQDTHTIEINGVSWFRRRYNVISPNPLVTVWSDANAKFDIQDLMICRASDFDNLVNGKVYAPEVLDMYKDMYYIRWMDAFRAVNCNAWNVNHIVPKDYITCTKAEEVKSEIIAIEPTTDPDSYFINSVKVRTNNPHNFKSGQRLTVRNSPAMVRQSNGTTTPLNSFTFSIRTGASGYANNELDLRFSNSVTVDNVPSGELIANVGYTPNPYYCYQFHNELYKQHGNCKVFWMNTPHAFTEEWLKEYLIKIDTNLHPDIEFWIEYSNETWNYAFEGQWRYSVAEGKMLGKTEHEFYAYKTNQIYNLMKQHITSGRKFNVVCCGQSVNPSILNTRMLALQNEVGSGVDWTTYPVIMSISNYHDFIGTSNTYDAATRSGVIALGPHGVAELFTLGLRDHSGYKAVLSRFGKPIYCYEGGFAADMPSNDPELTRSVFAGSLHYEVAEQTWENHRRLQEIGYNGVCTLLGGRWDFNNGKNWGTTYREGQRAGLGNGLDGEYDNINNPSGNLDQFKQDGITGWKQFCSTRLYGVESWVNGTSDGLDLGIGTDNSITQNGRLTVEEINAMLTDAQTQLAAAQTAKAALTAAQLALVSAKDTALVAINASIARMQAQLALQAELTSAIAQLTAIVQQINSL